MPTWSRDLLSPLHRVWVLARLDTIENHIQPPYEPVSFAGGKPMRDKSAQVGDIPQVQIVESVLPGTGGYTVSSASRSSSSRSSPASRSSPPSRRRSLAALTHFALWSGQNHPSTNR